MIEAVEVIVRQAGFPDRVQRLNDGATRIGRAEDNELVLSDVGVSRRHAQVFWSSSECLLEDLGSGNGTYYEGRRIQARSLADGDQIVVDPFTLEFKIRGESTNSTRPNADLGAIHRLEVIVGTGMSGTAYPITDRGLTMGRAEDQDVVIPDPAASRNHCEIIKKGSGFALKDLESANGVYHNGAPVRLADLNSGDIIRIGNTEMRFVGPAATPSAGPAAPPVPQALPSSAPPAATRGGGGSSVVIWTMGIAAMMLMMMIVVLIAVIVVLAIAWERPPAEIPQQIPTWEIEVPGGLVSASTDALFNAGVEKMRTGDQRSALQNFYRVLKTDPGANGAKKFAFAAGESLVLDSLQAHLETEVASRKELEAERSRLLSLANRGGRTGRNAQARLKDEFAEDPVVVQQMSLEPSDDMKAREIAMSTATSALAKEDWTTAADSYAEVLQTAPDSETRVQAIAGFKAARRELSRTSSAEWRDAALTSAMGEAAEEKWSTLAKLDPSNPCASSRKP